MNGKEQEQHDESGLMKAIFTSLYTLVNVRTTKKKKRRDKFRKELNKCLEDAEE